MGETTFPLYGYAQKVSAAVGVAGLDYFRYDVPKWEHNRSNQEYIKEAERLIETGGIHRQPWLAHNFRWSHCLNHMQHLFNRFTVGKQASSQLSPVMCPMRQDLVDKQDSPFSK